METGKLDMGTTPARQFTFNEVKSRNGLYVLVKQKDRPIRLLYKYYEVELLFSGNPDSNWELTTTSFGTLGDSYRTELYQDFGGELHMTFKGN